jgi:septal ring-binding cell division protein DamX
MLDAGTPYLDSSIVADGWIKDTGSKVSSEVKKAAKKASKFIKHKAPEVIKESVSAAVKTLLDTGSITAAVTRLVTTAASESVEIGKTEAEKLIVTEYNKQAGTSYEHADFISFANGLPAHHKLLEKVHAAYRHTDYARKKQAKYEKEVLGMRPAQRPQAHPRSTDSAHSTVLPYLDESEESSEY